MKYVNAALKQFCPPPGDISGNKKIILETIAAESAEGADLICFPECSLTGYTLLQAEEAAVGAGDESVSEICRAAAGYGVTVSFGFLERSGDDLFVSHLITGPGGTVCYRKTHLGLKERAVFTPGNELPLYREEGLGIGICLCWESHIPDIAAVYRRQGAYILLVPYASGMSGERCRELWSRHLPARASDNGIYVLACNGLSGASGVCGSGIAVYDPKGSLAEGYFGEEEAVVRCRIGGELPREKEEDMNSISYFDHRREELYT